MVPVDDSSPPKPLTLVDPGADPVLQRLQAPRDEDELEALAAARADRVADRDRVWRRRFWIRTAILVLAAGGVVWWVNTMRPQDWRDAWLLPGVFAVMTFIAIWRGLPPLLVMPILALLPVIVVLSAGGTLPYWFVKAPILGGIAMGVGFATPWPCHQE